MILKSPSTASSYNIYIRKKYFKLESNKSFKLKFLVCCLILSPNMMFIVIEYYSFQLYIDKFYDTRENPDEGEFMGGGGAKPTMSKWSRKNPVTCCHCYHFNYFCCSHLPLKYKLPTCAIYSTSKACFPPLSLKILCSSRTKAKNNLKADFSCSPPKVLMSNFDYNSNQWCSVAFVFLTFSLL